MFSKKVSTGPANGSQNSTTAQNHGAPEREGRLNDRTVKKKEPSQIEQAAFLSGSKIRESKSRLRGEGRQKYLKFISDKNPTMIENYVVEKMKESNGQGNKRLKSEVAAQKHRDKQDNTKSIPKKKFYGIRVSYHEHKARAAYLKEKKAEGSAAISAETLMQQASTGRQLEDLQKQTEALNKIASGGNFGNPLQSDVEPAPETGAEAIVNPEVSSDNYDDFVGDVQSSVPAPGNESADRDFAYLRQLIDELRENEKFIESQRVNNS
ncbi:hypothetical protein [Labrenzia sp. OB1]|uniref:hypothetical protein n=1 Tax=Labrenzia sp. OB1 TaxID=1561204 RepID=UPI000AFC9014|nr:hypothetical protein [Labrenzia sp. OB1]